MASGLRVLLLTGLVAAATGCSLSGRDKAPLEDASASAPVISPEVERRPVSTPKIDSEDFEVSGFVGLLSVVGGRSARDAQCHCLFGQQMGGSGHDQSRGAGTGTQKYQS